MNALPFLTKNISVYDMKRVASQTEHLKELPKICFSGVPQASMTSNFYKTLWHGNLKSNKYLYGFRLVDTSLGTMI